MNHYKGSALLFVVFTFAPLTIYLTSLMYSAQLSVAFASYRTNHIKNYYLFKAFKTYVIAWIIDNFDTLLRDIEKNTVIKKYLELPFKTNEKLKGIIELMHHKESMRVNIELVINKGSAHIFSCYIRKKFLDRGAKTVRFHIEPSIN